MQKKTTKKKRNNSKSKQCPKRLKTFNQSDFSLLQDNNNLASISDLFKNDAIKKKPNPAQSSSQINFNSTVNNYTSVYTVVSPSLPVSKPQKVKSIKNIIKGSSTGTKKKPPQKSKSKPKITADKKQVKKKKPNKQPRLQQYELIPHSKNSLNSDIVFSTQDTKRQSEYSQKRNQKEWQMLEQLRSAKMNQQNLVNNNKMLRSTIKQEFKRKNEAATKIQKVYRGYLTRKILQKYIRQQQQKLNGLLAEYKTCKKDQKSNRSKNSSEFEFFSHKKQASERDYTSKTFQDQESINISGINPSNFQFQEDSKLSQKISSKISSSRLQNNQFFNNKQNHIVNCQEEVMSSDQEQSEDGDHYSQEDEQSSGNQSSKEQSQQSEDEIIAYRHQEPIYSGSQIQQYLQSSSEDQDQKSNVLGASNDRLRNIFNRDQIIFETSQEHIQSRKNSMLNKQHQPKNILSNDRNTSITKISTLRQKQIPQKNISYFEQQNPDLIKTSKVSSMHNASKSHKTSYKQQSSPSKLQAQIKNQPSQKTSKKQCKSNCANKKSLNLDISSSDGQALSCQKAIEQFSKSEIYKKDMYLETIKISSQEYAMNKMDQKQVVMDTISYNPQFKARQQLLGNNTSERQSDKKKDFLKKKIYYFSDSSDHADCEDHNENQYKHENQPYKDQQSFNQAIKFQKKNLIYHFQNERKLHFEENSRISQIEKLKNSQLKRWDEIIKLINHQMGDTASNNSKNKDFEGFIQKMMEMSLKNKGMLKEMIQSGSQQFETIIQSQRGQNQLQRSSENEFRHSRIDNLLEQNEMSKQSERKWKQFKDTLSSGRRKSVTEQDISVFKPNSRVLISSKQNQMGNPLQNSPKTKAIFFKEPKQQLKQKINKIEQDNFQHVQNSRVKQFAFLKNMENNHIEEMLNVREEMLEKRQCEELTKLNQKLIKKEFTQKEFLQKLKNLTENFQHEKQSIDKARQDIDKGYNAAVKLIKEAFCDANKIGYKLPLSRSSESYKTSKHLGFGVLSGLNSVIIDQLKSKDMIFAMKNIKVSDYQTKNQRNKQHLKESISIYEEINQITDKNQNNEIQGSSKNNFFVRSIQPGKLELNLGNNFSESSSIINNLSSNSFRDQFFEIQYSPKHQKILQTPQESDLKGSIFNLEGPQFDGMSDESSEIQFSEEELRRFRKAQPYDPSIADMNCNLMIGKQFFEMQKSQEDYRSGTFDEEQHEDNSNNHGQNQNIHGQNQNLRLRLYREVYEIQQNQSDTVPVKMTLNQTKRHDPKVDLITQKQIQFLIFELSCELLMKPLFSQKFLVQKRQQMFGIRKVNDESRKQFIKIVQNMLPSHSSLVSKLNQNISPLPRELLKCMRIDFSEDDDAQNQEEEEYQQIGKYQMVLDQQLCNDAIQKYHKILEIEREEQREIQMLTNQTIDSLKSQFAVIISINNGAQQKIFSYLTQRQKFVKNRKDHCEGIRWEFINMELHCLFDAWNQQIIEQKANRNGFTGIGLNELTLSMIDRNKKVREIEVEDVMELSKFKIMKILNYEEEIINEINKKICKKHTESDDNQGEDKNSRISQRSLKGDLNESCQKYSWVYIPSKEVDQELDTQQESKWVYYSDEALSYGLQLVYLIEEQIFGELAKQLRKTMLKLHLI